MPGEHRKGIIAVTGASGFVGTLLIKALRDAGWTVRPIVRSAEAQARLRALGFDGALSDVRDRRSLETALAGCSAAVHLVAILRESGRVTYDSINRQGAANVAQATRSVGGDRLIHISALGAGPSAVRYLQSKWQGEEEVRRSGVRHVIFRPSFILGPGGGAARQFADVVRDGPWYPLTLLLGGGRIFAAIASLTPVIPVLGPGRARYMPVDYRDVISVILQALERDRGLGETYEIGGPDVVTYDQIMDAVAALLRLRRWKVHLPAAAARQLVRLFAILPNPPITRDEFETLLIDNLCDNTEVVRTFGLTLRPFAESLRYALQGA